jgi:hypothetical protein
VFVEFRGEDPKVPIKLLHKMTVEQVRKEMSLQAAGICRIHRGAALAAHYHLPQAGEDGGRKVVLRTAGKPRGRSC